MKARALNQWHLCVVEALLLFSTANAIDAAPSSTFSASSSLQIQPQSTLELEYHVRPTEVSGLALSLITNPQKDIRIRVDTVHHLSKNLTSSELFSLYSFLKATPAKGERLPALRYLKNEIFTAVRTQDLPPAGLTEVMIAISQDTNQDVAIRDYAVQHLAVWCDEGARNEHGAVQRIRSSLSQTAQQPNILAGTALLGLHRLSASNRSSAAKEVDSLALQMIRNQEVPNAAKVTAIAICGERKVTEALPVIEGLAQSPAYPLGVRVAAIGAMGQMGSTQSITLLRELQGSERDATTKRVIVTTLKRLEPGLASRGPL